MNHIFISYSRKDKDAVTAFAARLREQGFEIWQDILGKDGGIPLTAAWREVIRHAMHEALGILVFSSAASEASSVCTEEKDLARSLCVPSRTVPVDDLQGEKFETALCDTAEWCRTVLNDPDNQARVWILSGSYRMERHGKSALTLPKVKGIRNTYYLLQDIKECKALVRQLHFETTAPDIHRRSMKYLNACWRGLIWRQGRKAILFGLGALGLLCGVVLGGAYREVMDKTDTMSKQFMATNLIRNISEYDPIAATSLMATFGMEPGEYGAENLLWSMLDSLSRNVPCAVLNEIIPPSRVVSSKKNDVWQVQLSDNSGKVTVKNIAEGIEKNIMLPCVPTDYAFDKSGKLLAITAFDKIYLLDLYCGYTPVKLEYNFEELIRTGFTEDGHVFAVTESGNTLEWNNPLLETGFSSQTVIDGALAVTREEVLAVYAREDAIVIVENGVETVCPVPPELHAVPEGVALSPDSSQAAVLCSSSDGTSYILLCRLADRNVSVLLPEPSLTSVLFSADGRKLICGCRDNLGLCSIDISSSEAQYSLDGAFMVSAVCRLGDGYIASDLRGWATVYDSRLRSSKEYCCNRYHNPLKQLTATDAGYLFTSVRGGNIPFGSVRISLSNGKTAYLPVLDTEESISTLSVAASRDGSLVAYGCANGDVRIYDAENLYPLWFFHPFSDKVSALAFSEDNSHLAVLLGSGTVYMLDCPEVVQERDLEKVWRNYSQAARERYQEMRELGLTYITVYQPDTDSNTPS